MIRRLAFMALACAVALIAPLACAQNLTVLAAASLKDALDSVSAQFQRAQGHRVAASYFASSALARQIESGAPADIFISADLDWMDYVDQRKLLRAGTRSNLLRNRLVLIAPAESRAQVDIKAGFALDKLLGDGRLSMADPDSVPAGKYGKAALEKLGVWGSVERRVVRGDNVRTALNFVARGESPFGIVYETDAIAEKKVRVVARFPQDSYPAIVYPVAAVVTSRHPATNAYLAYLKSAEARAIFEKYGFTVER